MLKGVFGVVRKNFLISLIILSNFTLSDSFKYNTYNNHGVVGLINLPSARVFNEESHGINIYYGDPDQKITLSSNPYDWLEASFFYTNISNERYCPYEYDPVCAQDYKDKGFNFKIRLKEEGALPAIAIGLNDFAGTGKYSSEYIVSSLGVGSFDFHLGLGWGQLDGANKNITNPLGYINDSFKLRPDDFSDEGGQFEPSRYFSGLTASPFFGFSYALNNNFILKFENDTTRTNETILYEDRKSDFSYGLDYLINDNFVLGASFERGNYLSFRFTYKNNPKKTIKKYEYKSSEKNNGDNKYNKLIDNLENNGIGVNKITETSRTIGLELTQFIHSDIRLVEQIISEATRDSGINKNIKKDLKIANLKAVSEIDEDFERSSKIIYERDKTRSFNSSSGIRFKPFLASREEFFKGAFLLENDSEIILRDDLFFSANLKYSIVNTFDDLRYPPVDIYPAQVRSDVKQYLKNMDKGILIGRAQIDYHLTPKNNHHLMLTGGILEDMFSGFGAEYLYFRPNTNYSFGVELFKVKKRDYEWGFGHLDYENTILTTNFYYRNYGLIPFDMKISAGEYLAGDVGSTIEFSRSFRNGVKFGVFATFTDVTYEQFGEGSFDKGLFFDIPIYGNFINYTWRPLTKDPGSKLVRRTNLHDLLVRFKSID
ncbi:YjbH domain-containing protein [Gammaproteobacteria bacterium]|nr:YjbH domain-containing protein [Gammaproteobacteria bacterium]MDA7709894.1 YjbH domain-containing protein [Gammaproteobacteria bacterium]